MQGRENDTVEVVETNQKSEVALREEAVLAFWNEHDIFKKSLETPAGSLPIGDFVFYDGPPFATGLPHYGHILASTIKDAIPRFWTMNGYYVRRQWGWDCHGLPLENLIEKKLGLATKRDIEDYGVKNFNEAARGAVMEYADEWARIIPRMGRFADMENDYKTMDSSYTESVWWVFSELNKKGKVFEGFKSMHLCPRCGTTLSNFEVNQGYKDIKDIAVTVKLPLLDDAGIVTDTSLLVWTTTPWTLPGNMAAAVHRDAEYAEFFDEETNQKYISSKDFFTQYLKSGGNYDTSKSISKINHIRNLKGADLVGKSYQPPFDYWQKQEFEGKENAWQIYHADYVELGEEGTGAVHLAPAYGADDMDLAKEHNIPLVHHVDANGHFMDFVTDFAGQLVKPKDDDDAVVTHLDADIEIVKALKESGRLFKKENITHSYPHCWRCDTPLLNYATTSWFVDVPSIKDDLVAENNKVKWVPEHVGTNRFGKWLDGARDWAVSRQRYWGAPLPIWRHPETKEYKIFGSLNELQAHTPKSGNEYILMRHGESESNLKGVISANKDNQDGLTENGKEQVIKAAAALPKNIDVIIHSGFMRTKETAQLVAAALNEPEVIEDDRISELDLADDFEGQSWDKYNTQFDSWEERYTKVLDGSENRRDPQKRTGSLIYDLEQKYQGKKILIISHAGTIFALECAALGLNPKEAEVHFANGSHYLGNAQTIELNFTPIPHNDNYELDYHRPYIDDFVVVDEDGTKLERVLDVFDCWFESGSMPYAQYHYPFENESEFEKKLFPANFIAEGLDQTRGWFYSLIVLGTALFGKSPFENVIVNGLALAEDGKKMSKSLQNYPDPMAVADTAGADAMRFYLLTSPIVRGEDLNFSEKGVLELQRKNIGRLHNVLTMFKEYEIQSPKSKVQSPKLDHVLDRWIIARLNELILETTAGYQAYELDKATRPITDFIDDLSVWYLRRSRDRLKGSDEKDKELALGTMRHVLKNLALVMAPVMPFYAEHLWQEVKDENEAESVHLAKWPEAGVIDDELLAGMKLTRETVSLALEARVKANLKIRQPLQTLKVKHELSNGASAYLSLIMDEVNVKEIVSDMSLESEVELDTTITPELQAEGDVRELIRAIQDMRKQAGLQTADRIILTIQTADAGETIVKQFQADIQKTVGASQINFGDANGTDIKAGEHEFTVSLLKVN